MRKVKAILWSVVSVASLLIALSLVGDIAPRFLTGGPDILGTLAVSAQILTLLTSVSILTKEGRKAAENILSSFLDKRFWHAGAVSSGLLLLLLLGFRLSLPEIATWYNHWGWKNYLKGNWLSAESKYERAIALNPDYGNAHFNLGRLYEDLQNFKQARTQYQIALQAGYAPAYNNLARLYILDKDYSAATQLLLKTTDPSHKTNLENENLDGETQRAVFKNLGWARLKQKRYAEAEYYLRQAIELKTASGLKKWAAPHCLLAQVLEGLEEKQKALEQWDICLREHSIYDSDEDTWGAIAAERLAPKKIQP